MERTVVNQLKIAVTEENSAAVTRLVSECSDLHLDFVTYSSIIKEALMSDNYDIIQPVLDLAFARFPSRQLEGLFMFNEYKDKPVAAKVVASFIVHSRTSQDSFVLTPQVLSDGYPWMGTLRKLKNNRTRHLVRWLVYMLHQSNVLSYDDLVKQPRLLSALVQYPRTDLKDILNARVDYYGTQHTVLYYVIFDPYSKYEEKWNFVRIFDRVCTSTRAAPSILNPDLTELAACIVRKYVKLFRFLVSKKCPSLERTIDHVPSSSDGGKNLSHFFAERLNANIFFQSPLKNNWSFYFTSSDDQGNYSTNDFLLKIHPSRSSMRSFWTLIEAVQTIVRRNKENIKRLTFIRKSRVYRNDKALSLFLYRLGFRHRSLLKAAGLSRAVKLNFAATEIPMEFPFSELPIDLLVLITSHVSMIDIFAVFSASKKCFSMKKQLGSSSYWSSYFKSRGPFKHAQYLSVPKEMRDDYVHYQYSFTRSMQQGFMKEVTRGAFEVAAMDDNWIIWWQNNQILVTNCWNERFEQTELDLDKGSAKDTNNFLIVDSTPNDLTFGFTECVLNKYTWHTYRNGTRLSSVPFEALHPPTAWSQPHFYNGKLYWDDIIYNFNNEKPISTKMTIDDEENAAILDVNRLTGVAAFGIGNKWLFIDKNDQIIAKCPTGLSGEVRFVDEHSFAAVHSEGISYFDLRKLPVEELQSKKKPDIGFPIKDIPKHVVFSATNEHVILKNLREVDTIWNLHQRTFEGAFLGDWFFPVVAWNSKYFMSQGSSTATVGVIVSQLKYTTPK